ncbi:histidine kinase [Luteolibacter marinus]|uniref:histidine kinase n=1 Tax=Luteolibacter marinus TaxID=2776705 RepID=UPI001D020628|nr:histidine kinase [Luteolibacter marinus]
MRLAVFIAAGIGATLVASGAPAFLPYEADENTLHLWHLDEAGPPFKDDGVSPTPLLGLINGAVAGKAPFPGFGSAVSFAEPAEGRELPGRYGPILLAKPSLDTGPNDNVDAPFPVAGWDGAFTIEALVKLDIMPGDSAGLALDIVSMDDENADNRVFIFRIEKPGFLSFLPIAGNAVRGGGLATIPTSGPHAINTTDWFHAAVSYDGRETVVNNLKLYWTRLSAGNESANQIGRGTLTADLAKRLGDFAIGNSGKFSSTYGPWEFFPGSIDEVRISGIARQPHDFCFVSEDVRRAADEHSRRQPPRASELGMMLQQVLVGEQPVVMPSAGQPLVLESGLHRLDFDFSFLPGVNADPLGVRCRLEGLDDEWHPSAQGMTMEWDMLDAAGSLLAQRVFTATGASRGWQVDAVDSPLVQRSEPLFIPELTRSIRVSISSGTPDTTGCWAIDNLSLARSSAPQQNLWKNGDFLQGERMNQIGGIPLGWDRRGSEPAIAQVMQLRSKTALGLLDAEQEHFAAWTCTQELPVRPVKGGETFLLTWAEAYNVIPGASLRATYMNVPSGKYVFRAIAVGNDPRPMSTHLTFPIVVEQPFWRHSWFMPVVVSAGVLGVGLLFFAAYRRKSRHRLAAVKLRHALESDRARIARDMHDDLGTRVTVLNLAASFVRRAIDHDAGKARERVVRLESAARDLVHAMEGLVWAVNPSNDTLDHLANHVSAVAQELFRDSPVKLRILIPGDLPAVSLRSDFRHHFALGVKEALHNVLKHAGASEVILRMDVEDGNLVAEIIDDGQGFDPAKSREGNGLQNLAVRFEELGGECIIESTVGKGTRAVFRCQLPKVPALPRA